MKILIVDDNNQNLYMLQALLEGNGYVVYRATNGKEALEVARDTPPELIITDLLMPVMDGFDLCRRWKSDEELKDIPIVIYTATYTDPKDEKLAISLGAARFILKPMEPEEFLEILKELLEEYQEDTLKSQNAVKVDALKLTEMHEEALSRKLERKIEQLEKEHRALQKSEARLAEAQQICHIGSWELNIKTNDLYWSDETYRIFNITPEKSGASYEVFLNSIHHEDRDFVSRTYNDSIKSRKPYDIVHRLLMEDGTIKYVNERCETFYDENGEPMRSVGTVNDITERVYLEKQTKAIQAKLIHSNKMASMGMLASSITHEINNPNNYIQHNASLLSKVYGDILNILAEYYEENGDFSAGGFTYEELKQCIPQFLDGVSDGSKRIKNIIENIKGFSKPDKGKWDAEFNVNEAIKESISLLGNQIVKFTSDLHVDLLEEIPPVKGSKQQIEQVIINLVMNALQALPSRDCTVSISTSFDEKNHSLTIKVRDEGCGIEEDVLHNMMEPFYSTRLDSGGTGLGLFISNSIIEEHNGSLDFETEIGKGTTVTISLPAKEGNTE